MIRYVGKSVDASKRVNGHVWQARRGNKSHRSHWINELDRAGLRPTVVVLERVREPYWADAERAWIQYGRWSGWPLTNGTVGGDGVDSDSARAYALLPGHNSQTGELQRASQQWHRQHDAESRQLKSVAGQGNRKTALTSAPKMLPRQCEKRRYASRVYLATIATCVCGREFSYGAVYDRHVGTSELHYPLRVTVRQTRGGSVISEQIVRSPLPCAPGRPGREARVWVWKEETP